MPSNSVAAKARAKPRPPSAARANTSAFENSGVFEAIERSLVDSGGVLGIDLGIDAIGFCATRDFEITRGVLDGIGAARIDATGVSAGGDGAITQGVVGGIGASTRDAIGVSSRGVGAIAGGV